MTPNKIRETQTTEQRCFCQSSDHGWLFGHSSLTFSKDHEKNKKQTNKKKKQTKKKITKTTNNALEHIHTHITYTHTYILSLSFSLSLSLSLIHKLTYSLPHTQYITHTYPLYLYRSLPLSHIYTLSFFFTHTIQTYSISR